MSTLHHYQHFEGNAEEAFNFYKTAFGVEFTELVRYKDVPPGVPVPDGEEADWIMHISMPVGKNTLLMASDRPKKFGAGTRGDLSYIFVDTENKAEADHLFSALAEGGKVHMPIADTFWSSYFGMLEDKFGLQWMISHAYTRT